MLKINIKKNKKIININKIVKININRKSMVTTKIKIIKKIIETIFVEIN